MWINRYKKYYCQARCPKLSGLRLRENTLWYQCGTSSHFCLVCRRSGRNLSWLGISIGKSGVLLRFARREKAARPWGGFPRR